jgi:CelD/BcsL family acetyltransferase involved in cellulose biosynthesis
LPIGIGISDYLDVLVDPAVRDTVASALMESIAERCAALTSWEFTELAPWSSALQLDSHSQFDEALDVCSVCPALPIPSQAKSLREFVSAHRLQTVRSAWNRMRKTEAPEIVVGNAVNADEIFTALVSLHSTRWQRVGSGGVLTDLRVLRFHRAAIPSLAAAGLLRLYALRYRDRYIAVHYGLHHGKRSYAYLVGFDVAHEAFSPGSVLYAHAIETALEEGADEFDFLRGVESYKYLWGARDRLNYRRVLRCKPMQERRVAI